MKKSDLKKALKPIVKECIQETLLEGGILSKIISEVVKGVQPLKTPQPSLQLEQQETFVNNADKQKILEQRWEEDREKRRKLLDATGIKDINIFEGVDPMVPDGSSKNTSSGPLAGTDPGDSGVDISGIMALGGNRWKHLIK